MKKKWLSALFLLLISLFIFSITTNNVSASTDYTTIIIKSNGGTDGIGRIYKNTNTLEILSPAIPVPGKTITGYVSGSTTYFNTNGKFLGGTWTSNDDTLTVSIETKDTTRRCSICLADMTYRSADASVCYWQHPENECTNSNTTQAESHNWENGNCVIKPYCKNCNTEKPNSSTSNNHAHIDTYEGTCSANGGMIPHKHCPACNTYFSIDGTPLPNKNAVVRNTKGCTWVNEKWTWTIDDKNAAAYTLHLECSNCGRVVDYTGKSKLAPQNTKQTIAPTCTKAGVNYYYTEVVYDSQTFVGEHTAPVAATGHSFEQSANKKWTTAIDALNKQYHFMKCTNVGCPDGGIVMAENCYATGDNTAKCGSQSVCDVCKTVFGDTLQHEYELGICKLCEEAHKEHEWLEDKGDTCKVCGYIHDPHDWLYGDCRGCAYVHEEHEWENGQCKVCQFIADEHEWEEGICKECGAEHTNHKWAEGVCSVCALPHEHQSWRNGKCNTCQAEHTPHDWNDGKCTVCKLMCEVHIWKDSVCDNCGKVCTHFMFDGNCTTCGFVEYTFYIGSNYEYTLESNGNILLKVNGPVSKFEAVLIDNFPVDMQYLSVQKGTIAVHKEFLDRLTVGTHGITVKYENGEISNEIQILEAVKKSGGLSTFWLILIVILITVICVLGVVVYIWFKVKEKQEDEYEYEDDYYEPPQPKKTIAQTVVDQHAYQAALSETKRKQEELNKEATTPQFRPLTPEEEEELMAAVEKEIGLNVSQFLDENDEDDDD